MKYFGVIVFVVLVIICYFVLENTCIYKATAVTKSLLSMCVRVIDEWLIFQVHLPHINGKPLFHLMILNFFLWGSMTQ